MSWLSETLGGPVLAWEWKRATRRNLWRYVSIGYCAWLLLQAVALFAAFRTVVPAQRWDFADEPSRLEIYRMRHAQQIEFLDNYLVLLLQVQLVLIIALVPAFTAS